MILGSPRYEAEVLTIQLQCSVDSWLAYECIIICSTQKPWEVTRCYIYWDFSTSKILEIHRADQFLIWTGFKFLRNTFLTLYHSTEKLGLGDIIHLEGRAVFQQNVPKEWKRVAMRLYMLCDSRWNFTFHFICWMQSCSSLTHGILLIT